MVWCSKDVGRLIACISSIAVATFVVLPQENVDGRPQYGYLKESALLVDLKDMEEKKKNAKNGFRRKSSHAPIHAFVLSYLLRLYHYFLFFILYYYLHNFYCLGYFLQYFIYE